MKSICPFNYIVVVIVVNVFSVQISGSLEISEVKFDEQTVESNVGQSIQLNCTADDSVETYWKFNGELLVIEDTVIIESEHGLFIPSATKADFGTYVCYDGSADEPIIKYKVKLTNTSKYFDDNISEENEVFVQARVKEDEAKETSRPENISDEIPMEKKLLNRLKSLESNTIFMQSTVEDRLRHMEQTLASLLRIIGSPKTQAESISRQNAIHSEPVADQRVVNGEYISEYTWIIPRIEEELERAEEDGTHNIKSPLFYTHRPGYRMRLIFYPNYRNGNASGLFAGLVPGEYDAVLPWPFPHNYQLMIVSHKPNVVDDVANIRLTITNCNRGVFQRPQSDNPPACGFREFITHSKLQRQKRAFFIYGNLVIKIRLFISS